MKHYVYLFSLILLSVTIGFSQKVVIKDGKINDILPVDESGKITYKIVSDAEGVSKDELFKRARKWFVKTYNSANSVLQVNDPNTGELSGKGFFTANESYMGIAHDYPIKHLLSVEVKDNKYRIILTDLVYEERGSTYQLDNIPYANRKFLDKFYTKINDKANQLLGSLQNAMRTADDF